MRGKKIFIQNLLDSTKDGNIKWDINKTSNTRIIKLYCNIDSTKVMVELLLDGDKIGKSMFDSVHLFDSVNFEGSPSIFLRGEDYEEVSQLYKFLHKNVVIPYMKESKQEENNDNFLKSLSDKIGKSYFRSRRLDKILKK